MRTRMTQNTKMILSSWTNSHNVDIYNKMPLDYFKKEAINGGLDNGCDVKAISKYVKSSRSILEVGAGYGRVLDYIIKDGFKGELIALEREPKLCRILKKQFKRVDVICDDIIFFKIEKKFDLIIWLWAGLCEFSRSEQIFALANLIAHLDENGLLIFDLVPITCKTVRAIAFDKHNKIITTPYGNDYNYFPSYAAIKRYAQQLNCKTKTIIYVTKTNRKSNFICFS